MNIGNNLFYDSRKMVYHGGNLYRFRKGYHPWGYVCREEFISSLRVIPEFEQLGTQIEFRSPCIAVNTSAKPSMGYKCVFNILVGAVATLFSTPGEHCTTPLVSYSGCNRYNSNNRTHENVILYTGYPVWYKHPAILSYLLNNMRLAEGVCRTKGRIDEFLGYFPNSGKDVEKAIISRDIEYLQDIVKILETKFTGFANIWSQVISYGGYWNILHKILELHQAGKLKTNSEFHCYSGAATWWLYEGEMVYRVWKNTAKREEEKLASFEEF